MEKSVPYEEFNRPDRIADDLLASPLCGDYMRGQANFLQGLADLIDNIRSNVEPHQLTHSFDFTSWGNYLPDVPASMSAYADEKLTGVNVTSSKEMGAPAIMSLELQFPDRSVYISRDPSLTDSHESDAVFFTERPNDVLTMDRVPREDINIFMAELLAKQPVSDRKWASEMDILAPEMHDTVLDALNESAFETTTHYTYEGPHGRMLQWTENSSGTLDTCQVTYETGSPYRFVVVAIDPSMGLKLDFSIRDLQANPLQRHPADVTTPFSPDTGDLLRLQEVISEVTDKYRNRRLVRIDPTNTSAFDKQLNDRQPEFDF